MSTKRPRNKQARSTRHAPSRLRVFLCHSASDKITVRDLRDKLRADEVEPWFDEDKLLPGQNWEFEIRKALQSSDVVVICLSRRSVGKVGYVQKEIREALNLSDEQPEGVAFIIPLKLERCEVPHMLRAWQWVDLFAEDGYERLRASLAERARALKRAPVRGEVEILLEALRRWAAPSWVIKQDGNSVTFDNAHRGYHYELSLNMLLAAMKDGYLEAWLMTAWVPLDDA